MSFFRKLISILISTLVGLSLVSCDNFYDSIKTQREAKEIENQENAASVTVTFYNSSAPSGKSFYVNNKQIKNSKLVIPLQVKQNQESYTNFIGDGSKEDKEKYIFNGFVDYKIDPRNTSVEPLPENYKVTEDISLYTCYKIRDVEYEFWDQGVRLEANTVKYGEQIKFSGVNPTKKSDNLYNYSFNGWVKDSARANDIGTGLPPSEMIATGKSLIRFYSVFTTTDVLYKVKWMNLGEEININDSKYKYNSHPEFSGTNPKKTSSSSYTYNFIGWNTTRQNVNGEQDVGVIKDLSTIYITDNNTVLHAVYEKVAKSYTVLFYDDNNDLLSSYSDKIGTIPVYDSYTPKKVGTDDKGYISNESCLYTFLGWSKNRNSDTVDDTLLTTKINSDNNGEPYRFYPVFKKTVFGATTSSNSFTTLKSLYNDNYVSSQSNGICGYTSTYDTILNNKTLTRTVNIFRLLDIKTFSLYPDLSTKIGSGFKDDPNISVEPSQYSIYSGKSSPLETLIIYEGFTQIEASAFYDNWNLKTIYLPSTLTSVGNNAFMNIASASNVTLYFGGTEAQLSSLNPSNWINYSQVHYNTTY